MTERELPLVRIVVGRKLAACLCWLLVIGNGVTARASQIGPGDILVGDAGLQAIIQVDISTGERTIVSGPGHGIGPDIIPWRIASETPQTLIVPQYGDEIDRLVRVDLRTGDRSVLPSGAGRTFCCMSDVDVESTGDILVLDDDELFRVDPNSGDHTVVSSGSISMRVGEGPDFEDAAATSVGPDGTIYVIDANAQDDRLFRIDPSTGDRVVLASLDLPRDVAVDKAGEVLVLDDYGRRLIAVDPATGEEALISSATRGTGPGFVGRGLALDARGDILVTSYDTSLPVVVGLVHVDRETGNRTILSDSPGASGPDFIRPAGIVVFPVPEPSGISLTCLCVVIVFLTQLRLFRQHRPAAMWPTAIAGLTCGCDRSSTGRC